MAAGTLQAGQAYNFIKGVFSESRWFAALVESITADTISLKNRIDIQIRMAPWCRSVLPYRSHNSSC
jgi:hypothetical protein